MKKKKERDPFLPVRFFVRPGAPESVLHTAYSTIPDRERLDYFFTYKSAPKLRIHCTDEEVSEAWAMIHYAGSSHKNIYTVWCPKCRAIEEAKVALKLLTDNP